MIFLYGIQEADKPNFIFYLANIICLQGNKILLPITGEKKLSSRKAKKLAQKTKKILDKAMSKRIVISEKIKQQEEYVNYLHTYSFEISEGKWLFEALSCQILDTILAKKEKKKQECKISILVNDLSSYMLSIIQQIAKEYKSVNIVTNHIEKFRKIEKQILEEEGIMITVGNNKKKGLAKSELILNVDFPEELINQYQIWEEAIIVNLKNEVKIKKKRFHGIVIHQYDISFKEQEEDYDVKRKYKNCEIYEAQLNQKQPYQDILKQFEKDQVKITKLVGLNSVINS